MESCTKHYTRISSISALCPANAEASPTPNPTHTLWPVQQPKISLSVAKGGFPGGSVVKDPPANVGDAGLTCGLGRSSAGGKSNPVQ